MIKIFKYVTKTTHRIALTFIIAVVTISCKSNSEEKNTANLTKSEQGYEMQTELEKSMQRGAEIYEDFCVTCHRPMGEGIAKSFPPLANSDYLRNNREQSIRAVKYGQQGEILVNGITYNSVMAALGLEDDEVADVMNYIMNSWGNEQDKMVGIEEVASITK